MHFLGEIIGYLFMFVWIPYAGWTAGRALGTIISTPIRRKTEKIKQTLQPRKPVVKYMYTPQEAMEVMGIDFETFKDRVASGKLKTYKEKGQLVVDRVDTHKNSTPAKKRPKRSYPVVSSFKEEYKITNPVEFTT